MASVDLNPTAVENYANPKTCFFHVIFKAASLAFYILSALFVSNFVIIFVVTVLLAALDFWVVKNVSGRILVGLRWWNEINDLGESVWKFESLDQESMARMNKKDSWLFWWTLYLTAALWIVLAIFSLIRLQADYLLVIGAASLAFYILSALFVSNFVIIFVVTVLLAALDFWVVKNVSGRILVGLRWWNEINDLGESVWKFESLDQESLARMNKKDSWLFWWTLYLTAASLAFYILSALFVSNFVIIFVVTVLLAALDFWVVKNVSGRILVGLRWWNEINDLGESVWKFESLDQESLARMNKKDSWLFWWTLYLTAALWIVLAIFSLIRLQADYLLVIGVCLTLSIANIIGFTKCRKDAKQKIQQFASQTIASQFSSTIQSAFSVV
nr:golgi apparatus membrane protein-like protein echidna [Quercus suber]